MKADAPAVPYRTMLPRPNTQTDIPCTRRVSEETPFHFYSAHLKYMDFQIVHSTLRLLFPNPALFEKSQTESGVSQTKGY